MKLTHAFTLTEVIIAASIMTMIGLSVTGVTVALTNAYADSQDFYQSLQTARSAVRNIQSVVQKSKLIPACEEVGIVLWAEDSNNDGLINRSEVAVVIYGPSWQEVRQYRVVFPDDMDETTKTALDVMMPLASLENLNSVFTIVEDDPYVQVRVLATDVTSFRVATDPAPPLSTLVTIEIQVGLNDKIAVKLRTACCPRADEIDHVGFSDGKYVLDGE